MRTSTAACGTLGCQQAQDPRFVGGELAEDPRVRRMCVALLAELGRAGEQLFAALAQRWLGVAPPPSMPLRRLWSSLTPSARWATPRTSSRASESNPSGDSPVSAALPDSPAGANRAAPAVHSAVRHQAPAAIRARPGAASSALGSSLAGGEAARRRGLAVSGGHRSSRLSANRDSRLHRRRGPVDLSGPRSSLG